MLEMKKTVALAPCLFCGKVNRVDMARVADLPKCGECGRPIRLDRPIRVTDQDLEKVVAESEVPVLVDFYADWCGPCKMMAPILDELAHDHAGRVLVAKLDTDSNPTMAVKYAIRGIPTLIVFREGREAARHSGVLPKAALEKLLEEADHRINAP